METPGRQDRRGDTRTIRARLGVLGLLAFSFGLSAPAEAPRIVSAAVLGTGGAGDLQDVAIAEDGTIVVAGNAASMPAGMGDGVALGTPEAGTGYGCAFVARYSADGARLLGAVRFARGAAFLTSVAVATDAVYAAGYGSAGADPLLRDAGGALAAFPGGRPAPPAGAPVPSLLGRTAGYHGDFGGAPCVFRFSADLARLDGGTWLEGRHYVWHVPKPLEEFNWQPTGLALLPGGDLAVAHDGGVPGAYYDAPDFVSRLAPDLKRRAWKAEILHPRIDPPEKVARYYPQEFGGWKRPAFGQTRILRIRADAVGNAYVGGWSVSKTSREPWWCPFLWKLGPDGAVVWKAWSYDPMGGKDDRMGGLVSDSLVTSVAVDDDGNVLAACASDGGNNVMRQDPRDYTQPAPALKGTYSGFKGRTLYAGLVVRLDAATREALGGVHLAAYAEKRYQATWAVDVASLPGRRVLALGRHTLGFPTSPDAWHPAGGPGGFAAVYAPDFGGGFCTSLPDVEPFAVVRRGARCAVAGVAVGGRAPGHSAGGAVPAGKRDGWMMVFDAPE